MSLTAVITGIFKKYLFFTVIILIHELGHFTAGTVLGWKVDKIYIYPYGGCTKFLDGFNKSLFEELIILVMGPMFQIIFYFIVSRYLNYNDFIVFRNYNYAILCFNLLPIYPLDGGKLLNILLSFNLSFKKGFLLSIYISIIVFIFVFVKSNSILFYIILIFLFCKIIEEYKQIKFYYNKFLLERYMYPTKYKNMKVIKNINNFYRNKKHVIKYENKYLTEKEALKKIFNPKV